MSSGIPRLLRRRGAAVSVAVAFLLAGLLPGASAAELDGTAQSVIPQSTIQVISIDYHRLAADAVAQQLEAQLLPPQVQGLNALLTQGGINPANDLNRLTFATFHGDKGIGLIGVAEGNLGGLQLSKFFQKTAKQPTPPQIDGVNVYTAGTLAFFVPDAATLVFGSHDDIAQAIQTEQGGAPLAQNEALTDLIAGTESTDVWSVVDAKGSQSMIQSLMGGTAIGQMGAGMISQRFDGARYTISFGSDVQVNLELMTSDALTAAAISTGLNAAIAARAQQEKNQDAKALLNQVQVDSAGDNAFLQVSSSEGDILGLMKTDLLQSVLR